jgi:hypothetical protein
VHPLQGVDRALGVDMSRPRAPTQQKTEPARTLGVRPMTYARLRALAGARMLPSLGAAVELALDLAGAAQAAEHVKAPACETPRCKGTPAFCSDCADSAAVAATRRRAVVEARITKLRTELAWERSHRPAVSVRDQSAADEHDGYVKGLETALEILEGD